MVTFCEERTPQKKRGRKDKKKRAPPCKKGAKGATTTTKKIQPQKKERKKKSGWLPLKRKRRLVWIAFLRIALLIHSFPERHNITIYFESGAS
jgi:hypothetical protein